MNELITGNSVSLVHRFIASILMEMIYGYNIPSGEDPYIKRTLDLTDRVVQMGDSSFFDSMPFCMFMLLYVSFPISHSPSVRHLPNWVPGTGTLRKARGSSWSYLQRSGRSKNDTLSRRKQANERNYEHPFPARPERDGMHIL